MRRYKIRSELIEEKHQFNERILHPMIVGEKPGQLMLNFDQNKVEAIELENVGKVDGIIESSAKKWKQLFDPDYHLIFNPHCLPIELFDGKAVADYMVGKFELFDFNLQPENVVINDQEDDDQNSEEPMIQLMNPRRQRDEDKQVSIEKQSVGQESIQQLSHMSG